MVETINGDINEHQETTNSDTVPTDNPGRPIAPPPYEQMKPTSQKCTMCNAPNNTTIPSMIEPSITPITSITQSSAIIPVTPISDNTHTVVSIQPEYISPPAYTPSMLHNPVPIQSTLPCYVGEHDAVQSDTTRDVYRCRSYYNLDDGFRCSDCICPMFVILLITISLWLTVGVA